MRYYFSLICALCLFCIDALGSIYSPTLKVSQPAKDNVLLFINTPQLGVMDAIEVGVPSNIKVDKKNTFVDVIGRGETCIGDLYLQSVGRTGNKSDRMHVGKANIVKTKQGTRILLNDIDLRPNNVPAIVIKFTGLKLPTGTSLTFKARYKLSSKYTIDNSSRRGKAYNVGDGSWSQDGSTTFVYGTLQPVVKHTEHNVAEFNIHSGFHDNTALLNRAIDSLSNTGGGTIVFPKGVYYFRTVYLKSHVWLRLEKGVQIRMYDLGDGPEPTWYFDNSAEAGGSSRLDSEPYDEPDNYLLRQDLGHSFFHNCFFFAERQEDIKIFGSGTISGNNVIRTGNGDHTDKMFVFKQCRNIEIGGNSNGLDLWYDKLADGPCYLDKTGKQTGDISNMMNIDGGGHFVLLSTGTDSIRVHDIYFGKDNTNNARDILDFMECRNVYVENIYSKSSGDDVVKLGSDCSLGFTRKSHDVFVRNIVADTNCNLFQIGSETADDITNVYVDNLYALATNKAAFSISSNDGGVVSDIWLNSGKTGTLRPYSIFKRTRVPFFLSISNRGRVLGAKARAFRYKMNGEMRHELLVTNIPMGRVRNVNVNKVISTDVYAGSSHNTRRWPAYTGKNESTPIIAGYTLPKNEYVEGGLDFTLPDGDMKRDIENVTFTDVSITVKGGHPASDSTNVPQEMVMGRFDIPVFGVLPSWAMWARHVNGLTLNNCHFTSEKPDGRPPFKFDDARNVGIKIR